MSALIATVFALIGTVMAPLQDADLELPFTKFVLDNGLNVVVHEDHSDPLVAVIVVYHVGSGREETGRSGFAHLFEHLMFQGSENVGDDQHFKLISEAGGTLNGTTNRDRTNYFETMPSNQAELAFWLEADRMGFLLPAITQEKLDNQREVVKNERRQNYENRPYGQVSGAISSALYPAGHPYSWLTIGSHEDLNAASLEDVHSFFRRWYGPNNATLAVGGDITPEQARELAETYFGSIPRGPEVAMPVAMPVRLEQDKRTVIEDTVNLPQLTIVWPTVPMNHEDEAALTMLGSILSQNKASILDRALTVDETLASQITAYQSGSEMAGEFTIRVRPVEGVTLDQLELKIKGLLAQLARDGVDSDQLQRMKNRYEADTINGLETVWRRTNALAESNVYRGDPALATDELRRILAVAPVDVEQALAKYLLDRPAIYVSVVPEGQLPLAASGRTPEQIAAETAFDRSTLPVPGPVPGFQPPAVWHDTLANGVKVTGTHYDEIPVTSISMSVPGGHLREELRQIGLSSLTARLMGEGTQDLDTVALQDAIDYLGASLNVYSGDDEITVSMRVLNRHLPAAVELFGDVLLRPRFDAADFDRIKTQRLVDIDARGDSARTVASNVWRRLMYGEGSAEGWPSSGTRETVVGLTLDDVKAFYRQHVVPGGARLTVVGDLDGPAVRDLFASITDQWTGGEVAPLALAERPAIDGTTIYLVDKPGAPQSEIRIGHHGVSALDDDYYPLYVMNYVLGGAFSSRINMNLREDKGYTYGARSRFSGDRRPGTFTASSGVRTDVTKESVVEFMKELEGARTGLTDDEVTFAKDALTQAMARQYESIRALDGFVDSISRLGYDDDYPLQRMKLLQGLGTGDLNGLANGYVHPDRMAILVVGDASTVKEGLEELGYGDVVELDIDGNVITPEL